MQLARKGFCHQYRIFVLVPRDGEGGFQVFFGGLQ